MTKSNSKALRSIVAHPPVAVTAGVGLALSVLPSALTAWLLRAAAIGYLVLVLLDVALTKYHLWTFAPTKPQAKRYALVTGGSSGIGREIAYELAKQGYSLILASRTLENLDKVREHIATSVNGAVEVLLCACDLSKNEGVDALVQFVNDQQLIVDILVNNAGASFVGDFVDLSATKVDELLMLDVVASTKLVHAIAPQMASRGVGRILNIASLVGSLTGVPHGALYGSSKAFMCSFSQAVGYELRGSGVTVTCFCPGPVKTAFAAAGNLESAVFNNAPFIMDAGDCARLALESMFDGDAYAFDTPRSYVSALVCGKIMPTRIATFIGALGMHEQGKELELLRR
ncbi:Very-long-chain 3-oxoacyl-coa reductase [Globisporangium polare]